MISKFFIVFSFLFIICISISGQTVSNYTNVNQLVPIGGSATYSVNISGAPANAVITRVQAKFDYIAYGAVQNYVMSRAVSIVDQTPEALVAQYL